MTYEEALEKAATEGAIRVYRLSDNTAYVYRLKEDSPDSKSLASLVFTRPQRHYEARGLYVKNGGWELGDTLVSGKGVGRSPDGWYRVIGLPKRARPIELEAAKKNPGYSQMIVKQCYTCKKFKPEAEFVRAGSADPHRNWECNECYSRRMRELGAFRKSGAPRRGDSLDRETLASPPPPQGKI